MTVAELWESALDRLNGLRITKEEANRLLGDLCSAAPEKAMQAMDALEERRAREADEQPQSVPVVGERPRVDANRTATISIVPGYTPGTVLHQVIYNVFGEVRGVRMLRPEVLEDWRQLLAEDGWTVVDAPADPPVPVDLTDEQPALTAADLIGMNEPIVTAAEWNLGRPVRVTAAYLDDPCPTHMCVDWRGLNGGIGHVYVPADMPIRLAEQPSDGA